MHGIVIGPAQLTGHSRESSLSRTNFESVAEARREARRRLPGAIFTSIEAGVERGITRDANVSAFDEIGFIPRVADLGDVHDQSTHVMGQKISLPVITSSVGTHSIHPEGEVAVARATRTVGTAMALSNFGSFPIEKVAAACDIMFFQLYWYGTRDEVLARVERARAAGAKGLIVTLDWALTYRKDWPAVGPPASYDLNTLARFAWPAITHPGWLFGHLARGGLPSLAAPNAVPLGQPSPPLTKIFELMGNTKQPTWDDIAWLREAWGGPFMVKGIMHPDDARRSVDIGATAISVSNHGGSNIDTTPPSIRALPAIAEAVGEEIEVLFDGGIRRGSDVVKALSLGARAVLIGRAYLYGLASSGDVGVVRVLDLLRAGIHETLLALGRASVRDLTPSDVILPERFALRDFPQASALSARN